jgi:hypothetical protein
MTETAIGFDGLIHFYEGYDWLLDNILSSVIAEYLEWPDTLSLPICRECQQRAYRTVFRMRNFIRVLPSRPWFLCAPGKAIAA